MSTGQVLLSLGAIVLLAIVTIGVQQLFVQSVQETVGSQKTADAVNYGRDLSERLYSYAFRYDQLEQDWGNLDEVTDPNRRLEFESQIGEIYYATVELSQEQELAHGQQGKKATITIYEEVNGNYELKSKYVVSITDLGS